MKNKLQGKLNKLNRQFQPKEGKTIHYIQPQKRNGRVEYQQPRKQN
jgi:hypothetical protein